MLTKEQILAASDCKVESVEVPEWGGTVYMRSMTGNARDEIEERINDAQETDGTLVGLRAAFVAASLCDQDGQSLDFDEDEVDQLGEKNAAALNRLADVAQRLSGITAADVDALEKN